MDTLGGEQQTGLCELCGLRKIPRACAETACLPSETEKMRDPNYTAFLHPPRAPVKRFVRCKLVRHRLLDNWCNIAITLIGSWAQEDRTLCLCR
jgi:hypothetical protein